MGSANRQATREDAFKLKTQDIHSDYTVKVGGVAGNFYKDRVVRIVNATAAMTVTVPDGVYKGQQLLISFVEGDDFAITITTATGADYALTTPGDYASLEWVNDTSGWVAHCSQET